MLFAVIGILSPLTARYLPEILKAALGEELPLPIPTPTTADAVLQLQKNLGQLGAFAAIILAMGTVANEKERGTAAFLLTKPLSRRAFLGAKLAALGVVLGVATLVAVAVGWVYTAILFEPDRQAAGSPWRAHLARPVLLGGDHVPRLDGPGSAAAAAGIGVLALVVVSLIAAIPAVGPIPAGPAWTRPALALATRQTSGLAPDELATAVLGSALIVGRRSGRLAVIPAPGALTGSAGTAGRPAGVGPQTTSSAWSRAIASRS